MKSRASSRERMFLVDTPGFVFRAYHALPSLTTSRGLATGAVYGFCNMLLRLLEDHDPDYLAAVFDRGKPVHRIELYEAYKAHRPPQPDDLKAQFPLVRRVLEAFRIETLELEGCEADDVIATLVGRARQRDIDVTIVSSDKDLMQLVSSGVRLLDTMKDKLFGPGEVEQKFGVPPGQVADWLALVGDTSDNVPGMPGVGAKTATKLLAAHGSLEGVLGAADQVRGKKLKQNLVEHAEQARLSRQLVDLVDDCPIEVELEQLRRREPDRAALWKIFGELEFGRLRQRVMPGSVLDRSAYQLVLDEAELKRVVEQLRSAERFAVDLLSSGAHPVDAGIVGVGLCWGDGQGCYIPIGHIYLGRPQLLAAADVFEALAPLLGDEALPKVCHQHKRCLQLLERHGVELRNVESDPMLLSYLLDASRSSHELAALALDHLGHEMIDAKRSGGDPGEATVEEALPVAGERAEVTLRLSELLGSSVAAEQPLQRLMSEIEMPLARLLARMELRGCALDTSVLSELSSQLGQRLRALEEDVQQQAGWPVNINSPKQLQRLLFDQLGLTTGRKIKTGFSTDSDALADLALEHPIAAQIEEYRGLSKLKNTYLDALPALVSRGTGRLHTRFNQAVASTGRLSSSEPNLQNIPIRSELGREIRRAFVAPPGRLLLSADYSQIELRVLAHLSGDELLLDAFSRGQDVHTRTAAEVFGVAPAAVDAEQRRVAKAVNFGVIYGQSDWGLARQLRIGRKQAGRYIEHYFERYAGVQTFMEQTIDQARREGMVYTLLGRRRPLPEINSRRWANRSYAERIARNTPIQGTAADLIKLAMLRAEEALSAAGLDAPMILTVHDELVFEVDEPQVEQAGEVVRAAMAGVVELRVPLVVETGAGRSWADAH